MLHKTLAKLLIQCILRLVCGSINLISTVPVGNPRRGMWVGLPDTVLPAYQNLKRTCQEMREMSDYVNNFALLNHILSLPTKNTNHSSIQAKRVKGKKCSRPRIRSGRNKGKIEVSYFSPSEKLVMYTIALHRNSATLKCYPGYATISKETGLSRSVVAASVSNLARAKEIFCHHVKEDGQIIGTQYFFYFDSNVCQELLENDESIFNKSDSAPGVEEFLDSVSPF